MAVCVVEGLTAGMPPGQILRAVTQALVLLLPTEAQLALGLLFLREGPSQTWASLTATALTDALVGEGSVLKDRSVLDVCTLLVRFDPDLIWHGLFCCHAHTCTRYTPARGCSAAPALTLSPHPRGAARSESGECPRPAPQLLCLCTRQLFPQEQLLPPAGPALGCPTGTTAGQGSPHGPLPTAGRALASRGNQFLQQTPHCPSSHTGSLGAELRIQRNSCPLSGPRVLSSCVLGWLL